MIFMEAAFFWETMLVVIYAKILHHSFIPTIYENFKSVSFLLIYDKRKPGKLHTRLILAIERIKVVWDTFTGQCFNK